MEPLPSEDAPRLLTARDLLAGSGTVHDVEVPPEIVLPGGPAAGAPPGRVRIRPLSVATLTLISRASRDDEALVPLLMIKEALVEPALTLDQIRALHVGLVQFLVGRINLVSGLAADGSELAEAAASPLGRTHVLLARHFGWTPEQVSALTPGQVAVYLAGIEALLRLKEQADGDRER